MELPVESDPPNTLETKNLSFTHRRSFDEYSWRFWCRGSKISPPRTRYIIKNVNIKALSGEITAIAGPSGAGKTTLIQLLAGKATSVSGQVLVNGDPINPNIMGRISGYIRQDDAMYPLLTVEETLMYSALLRLKGSRRKAYERVGMVMKDLGLEKISCSRVGKGSGNGISGGERRRLSIGVEFIHDPAILIIDEPTSGLDSASALHIMSILKYMAVNQGKTIVLTIHQPGFRILEHIGKIVLLSDGMVLHHGSLHSLEERLVLYGYCIPHSVNVVEFAMEITGLLPSESDNQQQHQHIYNPSVSIPQYANSRFQEMIILGNRFRKNIIRTKEVFITRGLQAVIVGTILGTVYMNATNNKHQISAVQTRLGFFGFSLAFLLSSTTEALPIFLHERIIFMRETSAGAYRISSYVIANTIVFIPFLLMIALLYSAPAYWLVGLRRQADGFLYFTLVIWMTLLMSNSVTAFCSALVPNFISGTTVIAGVMGAFFLFSGYFITKDMIPHYWMFMHYLSLFKYPFESLIINEYGGRNCWKEEEGECFITMSNLLTQMGIKTSQKWTNLCVMLAFIVGYRIVSFGVLCYRCYIRNK